MLVLTRKLGQKVCIGDNIVVTVARIQGETVRLGIEAPAEVRVDREELRRRPAGPPATAAPAAP
jgi:carbon storage regulator